MVVQTNLLDEIMSLSCHVKFYEEPNCLEASVTRLRAFARYFHRSDYQWAKEQRYASSSGVYFLFGPREEFPRRFYIGQAERRQNDALGIVNRMNERSAHERINDWTDGIMFICTDEYFNENPLRLRYLENHLWKAANDLHPFECTLPHAYQVVTRSEPRVGYISEEDQDTLDEFIQFCKLFLKLAGFPIYCQEEAMLPQVANSIANEQITSDSRPLVPPCSEEITELQLPTETSAQEYFIHCKSGVPIARLYLSPSSGKYVLCAGSFLAPITSAKQNIRALRKQYRSQIDANSRTKAEISLESRNQAALFVSGTKSRNANDYWKTEEVPGIAIVPNELLFYFTSVQGEFAARGRLETNHKHFTILAGSRVRAESLASVHQSILELRRNYSTIIRNGKLLRDITFNSSSGAAQFVCLCATNGKRAWRTAEGVPLGEFLDS